MPHKLGNSALAAVGHKGKPPAKPVRRGLINPVLGAWGRSAANPAVTGGCDRDAAGNGEVHRRLAGALSRGGYPAAS